MPPALGQGVGCPGAADCKSGDGPAACWPGCWPTGCPSCGSGCCGAAGFSTDGWPGAAGGSGWTACTGPSFTPETGARYSAAPSAARDAPEQTNVSTAQKIYNPAYLRMARSLLFRLHSTSAGNAGLWKKTRAGLQKVAWGLAEAVLCSADSKEATDVQRPRKSLHSGRR